MKATQRAVASSHMHAQADLSEKGQASRTRRSTRADGLELRDEKASPTQQHCAWQAQDDLDLDEAHSFDGPPRARIGAACILRQQAAAAHGGVIMRHETGPRPPISA